MISKGYLYGYEVKEKIEELMGAPMPPGFIYVILSRLETYGYVISTPVLSDPRGKRIYRLTPAGEQFLVSGISELKRIKTMIERILDFREGKGF